MPGSAVLQEMVFSVGESFAALPIYPVPARWQKQVSGRSSHGTWIAGLCLCKAEEVASTWVKDFYIKHLLVSDDGENHYLPTLQGLWGKSMP